MSDIVDGTDSGVIPVSELARKHHMSTRKMRRKLQRKAAQIQKQFPGEPPLIYQFGDRGEWHLDKSVGWRHVRGLLVTRETHDPWEEALPLLRELVTTSETILRAVT